MCRSFVVLVSGRVYADEWMSKYFVVLVSLCVNVDALVSGRVSVLQRLSVDY